MPEERKDLLAEGLQLEQASEYFITQLRARSKDGSLKLWPFSERVAMPMFTVAVTQSLREHRPNVSGRAYAGDVIDLLTPRKAAPGRPRETRPPDYYQAKAATVQVLVELYANVDDGAEVLERLRTVFCYVLWRELRAEIARQALIGVDYNSETLKPELEGFAHRLTDEFHCPLGTDWQRAPALIHNAAHRIAATPPTLQRPDALVVHPLIAYDYHMQYRRPMQDNPFLYDGDSLSIGGIEIVSDASMPEPTSTQNGGVLGVLGYFPNVRLYYANDVEVWTERHNNKLFAAAELWVSLDVPHPSAFRLMVNTDDD